MIPRWPRGGRGAGGGQRRLPVSPDALGIGAVQRQPGEELRGHAPAAAGAERRAGLACAAGLRAAQPGEQLRLPPHPGEAARLADVAGQELLMDGERAGVDVAHRVDQAHHPPGAAHAEAGQRAAVGAEVEERVAGEHLLAAGHQPVVELALLIRGGMKLLPHIGAAAGRAQPGEPQLGAVAVGDRLELVELAGVVPGHHDRDLEAAEARIGEVADRPQRGRVRAGPADGVVDPGRRPVERDLHVDVVAGGEPPGHGGSDLHPVGGELDPDVMAGGVADQIPEVGPDGRLTAADVHVEHLHALHLVDQCPALRGGQLPRIAAPGAGQAVHARQVARVGQFPGQADRRGQAVLELLDQGERGSSSGHGGVLQKRHWVPNTPDVNVTL